MQLIIISDQKLEAEKNARELQTAYLQLQTNTEKMIKLGEEIRFADRLSILGELAARLGS